jgi:hypothetical protein
MREYHRHKDEIEAIAMGAFIVGIVGMGLGTGIIHFWL